MNSWHGEYIPCQALKHDTINFHIEGDTYYIPQVNRCDRRQQTCNALRQNINSKMTNKATCVRRAERHFTQDHGDGIHSCNRCRIILPNCARSVLVAVQSLCHDSSPCHKNVLSLDCV
ncbi:unnamed protein product [Chondrus crispus]|uniref:Uncharacterized protein n=1 Tax=Chondrus crispus TaxID=2769 RepID=R7QAS7_CHOCR|nr:unnamed protein product [Chondrus crispus]CDF35617.1 unnamed protein product [Chondrus crispus]|eukprot:XP_005715436.1 unnamed protein product [Chondrus crispus]